MPTAIQVGQAVAGEVVQVSQAPTTQANLKQMLGEILQWNPDLSSLQITKWINNHYREIVRKREWYGTMVRGQVTVPQVYTTGRIAVANGDPHVVGTGTAFNQSMVGLQFRTGFTTGFSNIQSVEDATHLTLDLPWGFQDANLVGFQIMKTWFSFPNARRMKEIVNQRQGYRLLMNVNQASLNTYDTWRQTTGWTWMLANRPATAAGWAAWELYPSATLQQAFPFLAYIQPPDLVKDSDFPVAFIPTDIIVNLCIADALTFGGKAENRRYDPTVAAYKRQEATGALIDAANEDDALYGTDSAWEYGQWPLSHYGSQWLQNHASTPYDMSSY